MIPSNPISPFSPFLGSTYDLPEEADRLKTSLSDNFSLFADVINDKTIGAFTENVEVINGNDYGYDTTKRNRNGFQFMARIIEYPANGVITVLPPKNIDPHFVIAQVWGSASKPPSVTGAGDADFFSFFNEGSSKITFTFTDLLITITTTGLGTGYTGFIFIVYIRDGT